MSQQNTTVISWQVLAGVPDTCKVLRNILRRIKDMPQQLQRLQAQAARDAKDFSALTDSLVNLLLLRSAVASAGLEAPRRPGALVKHVRGGVRVWAACHLKAWAECLAVCAAHEKSSRAGRLLAMTLSCSAIIAVSVSLRKPKSHLCS